MRYEAIICLFNGYIIHLHYYQHTWFIPLKAQQPIITNNVVIKSKPSNIWFISPIISLFTGFRCYQQLPTDAGNLEETSYRNRNLKGNWENSWQFRCGL